MKLSVVIPNYNGVKLLEKNLPKVLIAIKKAEIIVVDDASTDESVNFLKEKFPQIKVVKRVKNEGFSVAVNDGIKIALGELIVLLNSDVYPEREFLGPVLPHFRDPQVFAVGLQQKNIEEEKVVLRGSGIGKFERGFLIHAKGETIKNDTLWVSGGAGVFRKSIWQKLEGLCELFKPFYWEDIDLSYRALKAGYKILFEPKSVVVHEQSTGAIRSKYSLSKIKTVAYRNQLFFVWLNISDWKYLFEHFIFLPIHLIKAVISSDFSFIRGFFLAVLSLLEVWSLRKRYSKLWKIKDRGII